LKGEEAGRFRKVAGVSIVDAGGVFTVDTLTVDTSGLISIFQDESLLLCVCVCVCVCVGGEGAYVRDKNISARLCAKNAGGVLCAKGGIFSGHYGTHSSIALKFYNLPLSYM